MTGFWKTVPNHTFLFQHIYHCNMKNIAFPIIFHSTTRNSMLKLLKEYKKYSLNTYTLNSGVAKVGHTGAHWGTCPTNFILCPTKFFLVNLQITTITLFKQIVNYIPNIPKPSMILHQSIWSLNGSLLDHKFR